MSLKDPLYQHLGSKEPVEVKFTVGEVAALLGVYGATDTDTVSASADVLAAEVGVAGIHLLLDYSTALIKLGDALAKGVGGQRHAGFAPQVAEIEQIRARMDGDAA